MGHSERGTTKAQASEATGDRNILALQHSRIDASPISGLALARLNKSKVKIGVAASETPWWLWSMCLLYQLKRLSEMTVRKLVLAQELMTLEVGKRQKDYTTNRREVAEIIKGDLKRIVNGLRERIKDDRGLANDQDDDDECEDSDHGEEDPNAVEQNGFHINRA